MGVSPWRSPIGFRVQPFRSVLVAVFAALFTVSLVLTVPVGAVVAEAGPVTDISVSQTAGAMSLVPGLDTLVLTIAVENAGPTADAAVVLSDELPEALTCSWTSVASQGASGNTEAGSGDLVETVSMPAGSSVSYTMDCTVDPGATGTVSNLVSATPSVTDPDPDNNSVTIDLLMAPAADIRVVLSAGPYPVVPGRDTIELVVWVHNLGPSADPGVSVVDALVVEEGARPLDELSPVKASCSFTSKVDSGVSGNTPAGSGRLAEVVSMPPRTTASYLVSCRPDPDAGAGFVRYVAAATASVTELYPSDNQSSDNDFQLIPEHDVSITVDDGETTVIPGEGTIVYTIIAANAGPSSVPAARIRDDFPSSLTCSWTSMASGGASGNSVGAGDIDEAVSMPPGSSVTYTASCTAPAGTAGLLDNTATVHSGPGDLVLSNNTASDTDTQLMPAVELPETGRPVNGLLILAFLMLSGGGVLVIAAQRPRHRIDSNG